MNYRFQLVTILAFLTLACNETHQPARGGTDTISQKDSASEQVYFPLADFLRNEIAYVDSLPVGIKKYRTVGSATDSGYIQLEEFHRLAQEFLSTDFEHGVFRRTFGETSFFDRSANTATFLYSAKGADSQVRRIDIVTAKGDIYDDVKSIYIEKQFGGTDSVLMKKLFWKPRRNFQIIAIKSTPEGKPVNELIKVVWDNRE